EFKAGGFEWSASAQLISYEIGDKVEFSLRCRVDHSRLRPGEVEVELSFPDGRFSSLKKRFFAQGTVVFEQLMFRLPRWYLSIL
ncbi:hypothetical protein PMAYCL1PPCAC_26779, partial [Pristionchus mayeri]